jgi:predicted transcriptional regulator of viral defense system
VREQKANRLQKPKRQARRPDHQLLFEMAVEQAGYFTGRQAHQAGFSTDLIKYHVHRGRFRPVHRKSGVYRLRDFPTGSDDELWAAWMRLGPKAVLSHMSALRLHNLSDVVPDAVHMWVPYSKRPRMRRSIPQGVRVHVARHWLRPKEITRVNGLPVTSVLRTLLDVADRGASPEQVVLAIRQALERGLVTGTALRRGAHARSQTLVERVERFLKEAAV